MYLKILLWHNFYISYIYLHIYIYIKYTYICLSRAHFGREAWNLTRMTSRVYISRFCSETIFMSRIYSYTYIYMSISLLHFDTEAWNLARTTSRACNSSFCLDTISMSSKYSYIYIVHIYINIYIYIYLGDQKVTWVKFECDSLIFRGCSSMCESSIFRTEMAS